MYTWQKAKHIHKRETHLRVEKMLRKGYDRKGSVKEIMVLSLKGLVAKTNWLSVNRQS
jgi:hypothetical protein